MKSGSAEEWIIYGSELSPFTLKVIALFDCSGLPYRFFPEEGKYFENARISLRKIFLINKLLPLTLPEMTDLDEFPLVPFLFGPNGENIYDSTATGLWLDDYTSSRFACYDDPALHFAVSLIDEYADEYGLYLVHHWRWKGSAHDNNAGKRLAREWRKMVGPFQPIMAKAFSKRQARRLPYLFSVAPKDYHVPGLPEKLQPPSRGEFPPTHELLEKSMSNLLESLEALLQNRPYIFGDRFTLADSSIYGQLSMNMDDPPAASMIKEKAPALYNRLVRIRQKDFSENDKNGKLNLGPEHKPLLAEICRTFVPLMKQNLMAYQKHKESGVTVFNEDAFNKNIAMYEGTLDNNNFTSVAKTFQVKVWLELRNKWEKLDSDSKKRIEELLPANHGLDENYL